MVAAASPLLLRPVAVERVPLIAHGAAGAMVYDMDRFAIPSLRR